MSYPCVPQTLPTSADSIQRWSHLRVYPRDRRVMITSLYPSPTPSMNARFVCWYYVNHARQSVATASVGPASPGGSSKWPVARQLGHLSDQFSRRFRILRQGQVWKVKLASGIWFFKMQSETTLNLIMHWCLIHCHGGKGGFSKTGGSNWTVKRYTGN